MSRTPTVAIMTEASHKLAFLRSQLPTRRTTVTTSVMTIAWTAMFPRLTTPPTRSCLNMVQRVGGNAGGGAQDAERTRHGLHGGASILRRLPTRLTGPPRFIGVPRRTAARATGATGRTTHPCGTPTVL